MKKTLLSILTIGTLISCNSQHPIDYISVSGTLKNNKDSIITIVGKTGPIKTITLNSDGTFKDTLKVSKADVYLFQTNTTKRAPIYLKNGFNIKLIGDSDDFTTSFKFTGNGSDNSNFMVSQIKESKKIGNPKEILNLGEDEFKLKINTIKKKFDSILNSYKDLDSSLVAMANQQTNQMVSYFNNAYKQQKTMRKGTPSPKFVDYIDYKGGKKSLASFKGKYVYIDVWATWCGPCIQQIPFLKELEKEYHQKNIVFVSISTDESRRSGGSWEAAEKKWKDFVKSKGLSGVQLWSGKDFSFQQAYQINSIPRFILIDPKGNIVNANAPRPSDPELKDLFTSLGI